jgi:hypothetical protein
MRWKPTINFRGRKLIEKPADCAYCRVKTHYCRHPRRLSYKGKYRTVCYYYDTRFPDTCPLENGFSQQGVMNVIKTYLKIK